MKVLILISFFLFYISSFANEICSFRIESPVNISTEDEYFNYFFGGNNKIINLIETDFMKYLEMNADGLSSNEKLGYVNSLNVLLTKNLEEYFEKSLNLNGSFPQKASKINHELLQSYEAYKLALSNDSRFNTIQNSPQNSIDIFLQMGNPILSTEHISTTHLNSFNSVLFDKHLIKDINPLPPSTKKKILTAISNGLVSNTNVHGIKKVTLGDKHIYEVKTSDEKRIWGCIENGVLVLKGITNHQGIKRIVRDNPCP